MQMLNYSNASGVEYAGLTDGDRWELYDVSVSGMAAHECALRLLLLWSLTWGVDGRWRRTSRSSVVVCLPRARRISTNRRLRALGSY